MCRIQYSESKTIPKYRILFFFLECLIVITLLCGCQGNNNKEKEEFTFHNGLKFGMKKEDVVQIETKNEKTQDDNWHQGGTLNALPDKDQVIAFFGDNFIEHFCFDHDDTLCSMVLLNGAANTDGYYNAIKTLENKYGEPSSEKLKLTEYPSAGLTALDFSRSAQAFYDSHSRSYDSNHYYSDFRHMDSVQYLLETKGGYIEILALLDTYVYTSKNDSFYSGSGSLYDYYISYSFISDDEYAAFIKKKKKKETNLYNDL